MADKHIDVDADAPKKNENPNTNKDAEFEVEVEFEEEPANKNNKYRFWGFQNFPDMLNDFMKNPQKTMQDFFGRGQPDWDSGGVKMRQRMDEVFPEDSRKYFREAQRQMLLGWRDLIDKQLQRLDSEEEFYRARKDEEPPKKSGKNPVRVEVIEDDEN
jgi:hypothetical protein